MKFNLLLALGILTFLFLVIIVFLSMKDNFEIAKRTNMICPSINDRENNLRLYTVIFVIQGYNYTSTPIIYRNGEKIEFMDYSWDNSNLTYYITVNGNLYDNYWYIELPDHIEPIITEGFSQTPIKLIYMGGKEGHFMWDMKYEI